MCTHDAMKKSPLKKRQFSEWMGIWILWAWKIIPANLISKSFRVMGISNALESKEDNYMKTQATGTVYVAQNGSPKFQCLQRTLSANLVTLLLNR
jgi:hypothetical protein